jgi:hypothetical protein
MSRSRNRAHFLETVLGIKHGSKKIIRLILVLFKHVLSSAYCQVVAWFKIINCDKCTKKHQRIVSDSFQKTGFETKRGVSKFVFINISTAMIFAELEVPKMHTKHSENLRESWKN